MTKWLTLTRVLRICGFMWKNQVMHLKLCWIFDGQNKPLNNNEFLRDCNTYPTELSALGIKFHEKENIEC
jgi:hypothetical protein